MSFPCYPYGMSISCMCDGRGFIHRCISQPSQGSGLDLHSDSQWPRPPDQEFLYQHRKDLEEKTEVILAATFLLVVILCFVCFVIYRFEKIQKFKKSGSNSGLQKSVSVQTTYDFPQELSSICGNLPSSETVDLNSSLWRVVRHSEFTQGAALDHWSTQGTLLIRDSVGRSKSLKDKRTEYLNEITKSDQQVENEVMKSHDTLVKPRDAIPDETFPPPPPPISQTTESIFDTVTSLDPKTLLNIDETESFTLPMSSSRSSHIYPDLKRNLTKLSNTPESPEHYVYSPIHADSLGYVTSPDHVNHVTSSGGPISTTDNVTSPDELVSDNIAASRVLTSSTFDHVTSSRGLTSTPDHVTSSGYITSLFNVTQSPGSSPSQQDKSDEEVLIEKEIQEYF